MLPLFTDRAEAGRALAEALRDYAGRSDVVVLALPRGGVPVACEVARVLRLPLEVLITAEGAELARMEALYRSRRPAVAVHGLTAIVVDDGIVSGATMRTALKALRNATPEWVVVAVPAAPPGAAERVGTAADEFVCVEGSVEFERVEQCYQSASPTDEAIGRLLG